MDNNFIFIQKCLEIPKKDFIKMYVDDTLYNLYEGRTSFLEGNTTINLEYIIVGLVDGMTSLMVSTLNKLFIMTIYLEQIIKKTFKTYSKKTRD